MIWAFRESFAIGGRRTNGPFDAQEAASRPS